MATFINFTNLSEVEAKEMRRKVRSRAMQEYRRRQREEFTQSGQVSTQKKDRKQIANLPASIATHACGPRRYNSLEIVFPHLDKPEMHRGVMKDTLRRGWFPPSIRDDTALASRNDAWLVARSMAMAAAIDAIGLLETHLVVPDERIALEARKRYSALVVLIRQDMNDPTQKLPVAAAALMLLLCEIYSVVSRHSTSWSRQLTGVVALVQQCGPSLAELPFGREIYSATRHVALFHALVHRKAFPLLRYAMPGGVPLGSQEGLVREACRIPALLEETDALCQKFHVGVSNAKELAGLWKQLISVQHDLTCWYTAYKSHFPGSVFEHVPLSSFAETEAVVNAKHSSKFPNQTVLQFPSFLAANYHAFYWICRMLLWSAIDDLVQISPSEDDQALWRQNFCSTDIVAEIHKHADLICQCLPYLLHTAGDGRFARGTAVRAVIHFASMTFERFGNLDKLAWIATFEKHVKQSCDGLSWDALLPQSFVALFWTAPYGF